jgi:hypothetical protein
MIIQTLKEFRLSKLMDSSRIWTEDEIAIEFAKLQSVAFAKWIANSELHGYAKQLYEAMLIHKCETVEELFDYFIENHYNK